MAGLTNSLSLANIPITSPLACLIPIALADSLVPSVITNTSNSSFGKSWASMEAKSSLSFWSFLSLAGIIRLNLQAILFPEPFNCSFHTFFTAIDLFAWRRGFRPKNIGILFRQVSNIRHFAVNKFNVLVQHNRLTMT